jgi:hypothetical protein
MLTKIVNKQLTPKYQGTIVISVNFNDRPTVYKIKVISLIKVYFIFGSDHGTVSKGYIVNINTLKIMLFNKCKMRPTIAVTKSEVGKLNELALTITLKESTLIGRFIIL